MLSFTDEEFIKVLIKLRISQDFLHRSDVHASAADLHKLPPPHSLAGRASLEMALVALPLREQQ